MKRKAAADASPPSSIMQFFYSKKTKQFTTTSYLSGLAPSERKLMNLFESINILPLAVTFIIVQYTPPCQMLSTPQRAWNLPSKMSATAIATDGRSLFLCYSNSLIKYTFDGLIVEGRTPNLDAAEALDIYKDEIYIISHTSISKFNLRRQLISSFILPGELHAACRKGIKIDEEKIYMVMENQHKVYVCDLVNGELKKTFPKNNFLYSPVALTIVDMGLYVVAKNRTSIEVLNKKKGSFIRQFGYFRLPESIYYSEGIFYIGSASGLQLYSAAGQLVQDVTDIALQKIHGIVVIKDSIYLIDMVHELVAVYSLKQSRNFDPRSC